jgi:hypothetical protein
MMRCHTRMRLVAEKTRCTNLPSRYSTLISRLVKSSELTSHLRRACSFVLLSAMSCGCYDFWASSPRLAALFHRAPRPRLPRDLAGSAASSFPGARPAITTSARLARPTIRPVRLSHCRTAVGARLR